MTKEVAAYRRYRGVAAILARVPARLYRLGLGRLLGRHILLLTTTGRRTGHPRSTALSYQRIDDTIYVLSEAGTEADWFRNLTKNPNVEVQVGNQQFQAEAERIGDTQVVAEVLRRFNRASGLAARFFYGIPRRATDEELLALAPQRLVIALPRRRS